MTQYPLGTTTTGSAGFGIIITTTGPAGAGTTTTDVGITTTADLLAPVLPSLPPQDTLALEPLQAAGITTTTTEAGSPSRGIPTSPGRVQTSSICWVYFSVPSLEGPSRIHRYSTV